MGTTSYGFNLDRLPNDSSVTARPASPVDPGHVRAQARAGAAVLECRRRWTPEQRVVWLLSGEKGISARRVGVIMMCTHSQVLSTLRGLIDDVRNEITCQSGYQVKGFLRKVRRDRPPRSRRRAGPSRSDGILRVRLPGLERELRWLRGGSWIDLTDQSCRSNPRIRDYSSVP